MLRIVTLSVRSDEPLADSYWSHTSMRYRRRLKHRVEMLPINWFEEDSIDAFGNVRSADICICLLSASWLRSLHALTDLVGNNLLWDEITRKQEEEVGWFGLIPVLLRACDWDGEDLSPLYNLQPLPRNRKPVTTHTNLDQTWSEVARDIHEV